MKEETVEIHYLIDTIPDANIKKSIYRRTNFIILINQIFIIIYIAFYLSLSIFSRSYYYWIFYGVIPVLHLYSTLMVLLKRKQWSTQDIRTILKLNFSDMLSGITAPSANKRPFTSFMSFKILLFFYSITVYMKPLNQIIDLTAAPTNTSSCTTEFLTPTGNAYNPAGYFNINLNYTDDITLKFCAMDQTYAYPNLFKTIIGYATSPLAGEGAQACTTALPPFTNQLMINRVNGYADTSFCLNKTTTKSASYPTPVLGINPPIIASTRNPFIVLCKGNTDSNVCVSPNGDTAYNSGTCPELYRIGRPKKICPVCLNYWRTMSGDINGPFGYEHCQSYSPTAYSSLFCFFCPGRGYGFFKDEKYDEATLKFNLIISSLLSIILLIEYLIILLLVNNQIPDIRVATLERVDER